ncbi:UDP-glucose 4-epimerase GalE [Verruconis gallopava]|uniref:UDP-glucose 4-epimerase GalE n=1 Tax=Verruconis gallopava TaxID=253628 RepID=A0A0D1YLT1_9PEZI|nr:UDP-glucose 4-epimerase GalE [Verruconis gallopava]KIW01792.1 UDP-glucose 4-epimerase GalE [Verruconis gallopava]
MSLSFFQSRLASDIIASARSSRSNTPVFFDDDASSVASGYSTPCTERSILFEPVDRTPFLSQNQDQNRVLVVGGLGFIGSHTTWELLKTGRNVVIVDDLSNSYITILNRLKQLTDKYYQGSEKKPTIQFHEADYRCTRTMTGILRQYEVRANDGTVSSGISGVIHFAAYKAVTESIQHPLKYYANNVAGMVDFCSLLDKFNIKTFIFSSSATVYGELANGGGKLREELCTHQTTQWVDNEGEARETLSGSTGLTNPYGRTKWMCEAILSDLAASDPEWRIMALRYFNPVGADESGLLGEDPRGTPSNLMPVLVQAMTGEREELKIFGSDWNTRDGTCIRDFIHVSDLARGHLAALDAATGDSAIKGFQAINLGTGNGASVKEVVAAMEDVIGRSIPTRLVDRREGDVGVCIADTTKASNLLGWCARRTVRDSCRDVVNFLKLDV